MTAEQYAVAQAAISTQLVREVIPIVEEYRARGLTIGMWYQLLSRLFPIVSRLYRQSAELGRFFYDSQRGIHNPGLGRHDFILPTYRLEWFVENMEPARLDLSKPGASDYSIERMALRAMKEVENGGRRSVLRPVEDPDFEDPVVQGWARVATGRETCGFCMMLVSRGPVYRTAVGAGLDTDDTTAVDLLAAGDTEAMNKLMKRWHEGCDCKVVPVFDKANWPGRDAYLRARRIWNNATKGYGGKDAINAFRRAIEKGDVDLLAMSIAA
jgi:hypothetical protein